MPYQPITAFLEKIPPKDFDTWNEKKKTLENSVQEIVYKAGQIWWCSLGLNIGSEQDGKHENFERPVLIIKSFGKELFLGIPLTTSVQKNFFRVDLPSYSKNVQGILSQIRTISTKRLLRHVTDISKDDLQKIKARIKNL